MSFLLGTAETHIDAYIGRTAGVVHDPKGIRPIEGFFIFALFAADPPRRVLESGRACGYSTEILARCFPAASIISIESERNSSDVEIAAKRLEAIKNVDCRFGDARMELPRLIERGDVVLVDGPKDFRALKLTLRLLRTGKPRAVFLHDLRRGIPVRGFLEKRVPSAFFSDVEEFLSRYGFVGTREPRPPKGGALPTNVVDRIREGAMGCIPGEPLNYSRLLAEATLLQWKERLRDTARKLFTRAEQQGAADPG
jgi:hypothetical protein